MARPSPATSISLLSLEVIPSEICSDGGLLLPGLLSSSSLGCDGPGFCRLGYLSGR